MCTILMIHISVKKAIHSPIFNKNNGDLHCLNAKHNDKCRSAIKL